MWDMTPTLATWTKALGPGALTLGLAATGAAAVLAGMALAGAMLLVWAAWRAVGRRG